MANIPPSSSGSNKPGTTGTGTTGTGTTIPSFKTFLFYGVSALALIALADFLPKAAIMLAIILVVGVLLTHWQDYAPYLRGG